MEEHTVLGTSGITKLIMINSFNTSTLTVSGNNKVLKTSSFVIITADFGISDFVTTHMTCDIVLHVHAYKNLSWHTAAPRCPFSHS